MNRRAAGAVASCRVQMSLGWWTDLEVARRSGSVVSHPSDYYVVRTPDNPTYYWGNFVLLSAQTAPERAREIFAAEFPQAHHVAIGLLGEPDPGAWPELERDEVRSSRIPPSAPAVPGYEVRALAGDDWRAAWRNECAGMPAAYEDFAWRRIEARQRMMAAGDALFAGCFRDGELVADLGVVLCGEVARYQSVQTTAEHRGRGIASWLLAWAGRWAQRHGAVRWVIVCEPGSPAARLYGRLGMELVEQVYQYEETG